MKIQAAAVTGHELLMSWVGFAELAAGDLFDIAMQNLDQVFCGLHFA